MQNTRKDEITSLAKTLNFRDPITEEEFESALDILVQFLLFGTKWENLVLENPKIRKKIPVINDMPLICKANDCEYASKCPILKHLKKDQDRAALIGTECRADKIFAIEQLTAFVKELQIEPDQTTDILNVANLIGKLIVKRRIDWQLAISGLTEREVSAIDQRTGQVYHKTSANPLFKVSEGLEKQITTLQKQLVADRQARTSLATTGKGVDILKQLFSGNFKALEESAIEAEFTDFKEEPEE